MTDYKPGDRVRVTFEAEVTDIKPGYILIKDDSGVVEQVGNTWTIEKLTPDYEQQVRDLEPGTAFLLIYSAGKVKTFIRSHNPVTHVVNSVAQLVPIQGLSWHQVTAMRVLS